MLDDTMSQEAAFTGDNNPEDVFKFDEPVESNKVTDSASTENKQDTVSDTDEVEEKRVPYSRFKTKMEELEENKSRVAMLEERLSELEQSRQESTPTDVDVPREWVELYGDSDVSKKAYAIQLQREEILQENAVRRALQEFREQASQEEQAIEQNTDVIDANLATLQDNLGKNFTPQVEEEILSIVDEFSPVGSDGKYISMFPFDKAYEIYELRNSKATQKTMRARTQVADLTGNSSEGEIEASDSNFKRGWDSWREAL